MDDEVTESSELQRLVLWIGEVVVIVDRLPPRMHVARDAELLASRGVTYASVLRDGPVVLDQVDR